MFRKAGKTTDVLPNKSWCAVMVVEDGEGAGEEGMVGFAKADIDGEEGMDGKVDQEVEMFFEESSDGTRFIGTFGASGCRPAGRG